MAELVTTLTPRSAMPAGRRVFGDALSLSVLPPRTIVALRLSARALNSRAGIRVAGQWLSQSPNRWSGEDPVVCRIAPDAWWLLSSLHDVAELENAVRTACSGRHCAVTDLSDAHVSMLLEGPHAVAVLAGGCGLDFTATAFGTHACTRTRLAQLPMLLRRIAHQRFELIVDRSVAQFLFRWVCDAAGGVDP